MRSVNCEHSYSPVAQSCKGGWEYAAPQPEGGWENDDAITLTCVGKQSSFTFIHIQLVILLFPDRFILLINIPRKFTASKDIEVVPTSIIQPVYPLSEGARILGKNRKCETKPIYYNRLQMKKQSNKIYMFNLTSKTTIVSNGGKLVIAILGDLENHISTEIVTQRSMIVSLDIVNALMGEKQWKKGVTIIFIQLVVRHVVKKVCYFTTILVAIYCKLIL